MDTPTSDTEIKNLCRLCNGLTTVKFNMKVLGKYQVNYSECGTCFSLQTEPPFWLEDAYKDNNLSNLDTGAVQRCINNLSVCLFISKFLKLKNTVDYGGGDGLLCRMLRDHKINCFVKDKYSIPTYAQGFTKPDFTKPDLLLGFELIEHFPNPAVDLNSLFEPSPEVLILSTAFYKNQNQDWWYLSPESGQHVFFYSKKALLLIANRFEYNLITGGGFIILTKNTSALKNIILKIIISSRMRKFLKSLISFMPTHGIWNDYLLQKNNQNSQ